MLLDHDDNCASGGTMDTMAVLAAILAAGLDDVAAFAICDPDGGAEAIAAGDRRRGHPALGGKIDMPAIGLGASRDGDRHGQAISDGRYRNEGPMGRGEQMDMGPTAVLDTGSVEIVVISRHNEPYDIACLLEPRHRPGRKALPDAQEPGPLASGARRDRTAIVECAGIGVCTSDYSACFNSGICAARFIRSTRCSESATARSRYG